MKKTDWSSSPFLTELDKSTIAPLIIPETKTGIMNCSTCGLSNRPKAIEGKGEKRILILYSYEIPSHFEDLSDINLDNDCWRMPVPLCEMKEKEFDSETRETKTKRVEIKSKHIKCCSGQIINRVKELKPRVIIAEGYWCCHALFEAGKSVEDLMGEAIPDRELNAWILPVLSESMARDDRDPYKMNTIKKALKQALVLGELPPLREEKVNIITSIEAIEVLKALLEKAQPFAYDYETTGIKPYAKGHEIYSIAMSDGIQAWSWRHTNDIEYLKALRELLIKVPAIAHHTKFENLWTKVILKYWPITPHFDTMYALHCMNSQKPVGLKYGVYVKLGIRDYSTEVSKWLNHDASEAEAHGDNAKNRIKYGPEDKILKYNALDAHYTYWLFEYCQKRLNAEQLRGLRFLTESGCTLSRMEYNGIKIVPEASDKIKSELNEKKKELEKETIRIANELGWDKTETFRYSASEDISHLLYDICGEAVSKSTSKGKPSTDKEALARISNPIIEPLLEIKKIEKLAGTYLEIFTREVAEDGLLHPHFNLHTVKSFRSSSCIAKGTKVYAVRDYLTKDAKIPIEEIKVGDLVFCFDENNQLTIKPVLAAGKTGHKKVIRLHWRDNAHILKGYLDLTPEHKLKCIDGAWREARNCLGQSILAARKNRDTIYATGMKSTTEYKFIYETLSGQKIPAGCEIHHIDGNHKNNEFTNLECLTHRKHYDKHTIKRTTKQSDLFENRMGALVDKYFPTKVSLIRTFIEARNKISKIQLDNLKPDKCWRIIRWAESRYNWRHNDYQVRFCKSTEEYFSRKKLIGILEKEGIMAAVSRVGDYYHLIQLCKHYQINYCLYRKVRTPLTKSWDNHKIIKIEELDEEVDVYNLEIAEYHNFIANELCVKNSNPNFQTWPKRDKVAYETIRSLLFPHKGQKLFECVTADTKIETIEGAFPIIDIIEAVKSGQTKYVFGFDFNKNRIAVARVLGGGKTGRNVPLVKITLDNGASFKCKLTKPILLKNGQYKQAQNLKVGSRLMPFYKALRADTGSGKDCQRYFVLPYPGIQPQPVHWFIAHDILNIQKGQVIHHIDRNPLNNAIDNLLVCTQAEHFRIHASLMWAEGKFANRNGENNPMFGRKQSEETKKKISDTKKKKREDIFNNKNHKIAKIELLEEREDVYCLEVEGLHNFALECGCIVHNCDLKAIEVGTSACYTLDSKLLTYVNDKSTDLHRDIGEQIFLYKRGELPKYDRQTAKNAFVFPEFYGSYYKQTAPALWEKCSKETKEHLKEKGLGNYEKFERHINQVETDFWYNRFFEYTQWKKDWYDSYLEKGYMTSYTGFTYYGPLTKNEVLNLAIQGSAHHILLFIANNLQKYIEEHKLKTKLIGEIHDSIVGSLQPEEEEEIFDAIYTYGLKKIKEEWKWIVVPVEMEISIAQEIDQPWNTCKEAEMIMAPEEYQKYKKTLK